VFDLNNDGQTNATDFVIWNLITSGSNGPNMPHRGELVATLIGSAIALIGFVVGMALLLS
jgi:hypothetical protein